MKFKIYTFENVYHKPFIRWIWLGALIMAFGGLLAATDKRYRKTVKSAQRETDAVAAGAS